MELTLAVLTCRPLPLAPLRQQLLGRLRRGVEMLEEPGQREQDQADLQRFVRLWDGECSRRGCCLHVWHCYVCHCARLAHI